MYSHESQLINIQKIVDYIKNKSRKTCCAIDVLDELPGVLDNKIGGFPFLPAGESFPTDSHGIPMSLLLQINCRDIDLPEFPTDGVLEIFTSSSLLSSPFECQVKYFPESTSFRLPFPRAYCTDGVLRDKGTDVGYQIAVHHQPSFISPSDCQYDQLLADAIFEVLRVKVDAGCDLNSLFPDVKDVMDIFMHSFPSEPHIAIGSYPDFIQDDPRPFNKLPNSPNTCLFKLDSVYDLSKFSVGDAGILCVFISDEDLAAKNFSNAIISWDCC